MEGAPRKNESALPERSTLEVNLTTWDGHWFNLICAAQAQLEGEALRAFNREIGELLWHGNGATYHDLFRTINAHMNVVDTSDAFEAYVQKPPYEAGSRDATSQEPQNTHNQVEDTTQ